MSQPFRPGVRPSNIAKPKIMQHVRISRLVTVIATLARSWGGAQKHVIRLNANGPTRSQFPGFSNPCENTAVNATTVTSNIGGIKNEKMAATAIPR